MSEYIQLIAAACLPLSLIVVCINRWLTNKSIGVRAIQFVAASTLLPVVLIMSLRGLIGGETAAALIGAFVGYLFANIAKFDE